MRARSWSGLLVLSACSTSGVLDAAIAPDADVAGADAATPDAFVFAPASLKTCRTRCSSASECDTCEVTPENCQTGLELLSFECVGGRCLPRGCTEDSQCPDPYVCAVVLPQSIPTCHRECTGPEDCVVRDALGRPFAGFAEVNWQCRRGWCVYRGCMSDRECPNRGNASGACISTSSIVSLELNELGNNIGTSSTCVFRCERPFDCIPFRPAPDRDFDNYDCAGGFCRWLGCIADRECADVCE